MKHRVLTVPLLAALFALSINTLTPSSAEALGLDLGIGLKGGITGAATDRVPKDYIYELENQMLATSNTELYSMFGIGGAIGLAIDARLLGIVGLETGLHLSFDNGDGYEDKSVNGTPVARVNQSQRTTAWHLPLLLKLAAPGGMVKPFLGLGVEFVFQRDSTLSYSVDNKRGTYTSPVLDWNEIEPSNYTLFMITLGMEIDVGPVRIPIELRGGYNLGFKQDASSRLRVEGDNQSDIKVFYNGEYQGQFGIFTGVIYDIDLLF